MSEWGGSGSGVRLRTARADDYDAIAGVVDGWWGRPVLSALPRLFLDHFSQSSLVGEDAEGLACFLVGLLTSDAPHQAYIHFVGVAPRVRARGVGRLMYEEFFRVARHANRYSVSAITAPENTASIAFHRRLGFTVSEPIPDYNGPGRDMVTFRRLL